MVGFELVSLLYFGFYCNANANNGSKIRYKSGPILPSVKFVLLYRKLYSGYYSACKTLWNLRFQVCIDSAILLFAYLLFLSI